MSAEDVGEEPQQWVTIPGFPELFVTAWQWDADWRSGHFRVTYRGWPQDLVAAGIVRPRVLQTGRGRGVERRRTDPRGWRWYLRSWRRISAKGRPARCFEVWCNVPTLEAVAALPEALRALAQYRKRTDWCEAVLRAREERRRLSEPSVTDVEAHVERIRRHLLGIPQVTKRPAHLHLVVNNTLETP